MVKSQSIKKENLNIDPSLFECDLTYTEPGSRSFSQSSSTKTKRHRMGETIDLRSLWNNALSRNKTFDKKV